MSARDDEVREHAQTALPHHTRIIRSARDGKWLSSIMLPLVRVKPPKGMGVLTTRGRKTGRLRQKCLRILRSGDQAYIVQLRPPAVAVQRPRAAAAWVWNIRADPHVHVRVHDGDFDGVARELRDPAELAVARRVLTETVHLVDYGEAAIHLRGRPTRAKVQRLHRYWFDTGIPIAIDLERSSGRRRPSDVQR